MANFRSDDDSGDNRSRGGFRGNSRGSRFGGGRDRGRGGFGRDRGFDRKPEMHDATCDKCGKECQVPFKPSGGKPVLCSDCFRKSEGSNRGFGGRRDRPSAGAMSSEQLSKINAKLDKIIKALKIE